MKNIRRIILFSAFLFPSFCFSQNLSDYNSKYNGALYQLYFNRQPSARAEALGGGLVAGTEADFGSYYNPALTSLGKGIIFNASKTSLGKHYYDGDESANGYIGIIYSGSSIGSFSLSRYNYGRGITEDKGDKNHNSIHTLNYSRELGAGFYAGANVNLVHMGYLNANQNSWFFGETPDDFKSSDAFTLDLGILSKADFGNNSTDNHIHSFQFGASLLNVTNSKIRNKNYDDKFEVLPMIIRVGMSFLNQFYDESVKNRNIFQSFTSLEFEGVFNADNLKKIRLGEEFVLADLLVLRAGVVFGAAKYNNESYSTYAKDEPQYTFGFGIKDPLKKIINKDFPVSFSIDYSPSVPSAKYRERFTSLSVNINYIPD